MANLPDEKVAALSFPLVLTYTPMSTQHGNMPAGDGYCKEAPHPPLHPPTPSLLGLELLWLKRGQENLPAGGEYQWCGIFFRVLAEECIMELEWLAFVCVGRGSFTSLRGLLYRAHLPHGSWYAQTNKKKEKCENTGLRALCQANGMILSLPRLSALGLLCHTCALINFDDLWGQFCVPHRGEKERRVLITGASLTHWPF